MKSKGWCDLENIPGMAVLELLSNFVQYTISFMHIIELDQPWWNLKFNQNEIWNIFQVPSCQCNLPTTY